MARGGVDLRRLGRSAWRRPRSQSRLAAIRPAAADSRRDLAYRRLDADGGHPAVWMDIVPFAGFCGCRDMASVDRPPACRRGSHAFFRAAVADRGIMRMGIRDAEHTDHLPDRSRPRSRRLDKAGRYPAGLVMD